MSVIGEVVGIVACVAAVVSAYKDGSQIVQKIKDKRRRSSADPQSRYLEQSLDQGATAVEQTHKAGVDRFGNAFEYGDGMPSSMTFPALQALTAVSSDAALNALRDITIQLQQSMLRELGKALEDDAVEDFTAVVNASDTARLRTVNVLNDLFLRMQADASRYRSLPPMLADQNRIQQVAIDIPYPQRQIAPSRAPPPGRVYTLPEDGESKPLQRSFGSPPTSARRSSRNSKGPSYFPGLSEMLPRRTKSGDKSDATDRDTRPTEKEEPPTAQSIPQDFSRPQQGLLDSGTFATISLTDNPWAANIDRPMQVSPTEMGKPRRRYTNSDQRPQQANMSPASTNSTTPQEYQGFCKGAYYLQVRLKSDGMKLRNQSGSFTGEKYYYACSNSKCCFEAPAHKIGKVWNLADTVYGPKPGVKLRWSFLAKSHVQQSTVKKRDFQYRCIFCAIQGFDTQVFEGVNSLIEHVAQHRHDKLPTGGRVIVDGEDFDIHFVADDVPVDTESLGSRLSISTIPEGSLWSMSDDGNPWERP